MSVTECAVYQRQDHAVSLGALGNGNGKGKGKGNCPDTLSWGLVKLLPELREQNLTIYDSTYEGCQLAK